MDRTVRHVRSFGFIVCVALAGGLVRAGARTPSAQPAGPPRVLLKPLSTHADRVSGGNVLLEITTPQAVGTPKAITVLLNGRDISSMFRVTSGGAHLGVATGLSLGKNTVQVQGAPWGAPNATLALTNYSSAGPIISGPRLQPFVCQTDGFKLPDGSLLGAPIDADCTIATRVQYVYMPTGGKEFRALPDTTRLPSDVATTTTLMGVTVPFVVRVETGSMNRGIYQNVILHDPTNDPVPSPFSPPAGWNKRLIAVHGTGCPSGWYRQGGIWGVNPLDAKRLAEGYALFTNTLNHPTNSCNAFLAGETTMMGKEHFIETFGVPLATMSTGVSGGAYTSLQVGDAFPGLFDGVLFTATFPDALSIALAGMDARLLTRYLARAEAADLSEAQRVAISGYAGLQAFVDAAKQSQRTDPVAGRKDIEGYASAVWHESVPPSVRYHPTDNPRGARPTVFDVARNIYGIDPATGFALRPFDNVGVQYGLKALNDGRISAKQFLDLNERIGGFDHDSNYTTSRTVGDVSAIKRVYQSGVTLGGGGGLASIPVLDMGRYNEIERYHYQWFHFAVRERMRRQNGHADNHLMWRGEVPADRAWALLDQWVTAIASDRSATPAPRKAVKHKPREAIDGCFSRPSGPTAPAGGGEAPFIAEPQTFSSDPDSACNKQYPSYSFVRQVAGGPLDGNVLKCQLKPVDASDYRASFSDTEMQRLRLMFPNGVCDFSKPGVSQVPVVTWASFGPSPENLVFDVTKQTRQLSRAEGR